MGFQDFGAAMLPASMGWDGTNVTATPQPRQNIIIAQRTSILPQIDNRAKWAIDATAPARSSSPSDSPMSSVHEDAPSKHTRKGHRKSRNGCMTCKKRRIKCQENHPSCDNCVKTGFTCEWPRQKPILKQTSPVSLAPRIAPSLQATPYIFSMEDMQLFHCYITTSYPHLPLRGDSIWTLHLPAYAQQHPYLMHAMLALGASHLSSTTGKSSFNQAALDHRIKAIHSLNSALLSNPKSVSEWDARYGTLVALSIQAASMPDGIVDFFTTLRGCMIERDPFDDSSVFGPWIKQRNKGFGIPEDLLRQPVDYSPEAPALVAEAIVAIDALEPLCTGVYEHKMWEAIHQAVHSILRSPFDTYSAVAQSYALLTLCPSDVYNQLFDPSNHVSWLLISYGMAMHALLRLCGAFKFFDGGPAHMRDTKRIWARRIYQQLPMSMRKHGEWPMMIVNRTESDGGDGRSWTSVSGGRGDCNADRMLGKLLLGGGEGMQVQGPIFGESRIIGEVGA